VSAPTLVTITPALAEAWLDTQHHIPDGHGGPAVEQRQVDVLAALMDAGEFDAADWPPIEFDARGLVLTGIHRLLACKQSGRTLVCPVIRPPERVTVCGWDPHRGANVCRWVSAEDFLRTHA
jgi:hypothetical protein